MAQVISEFRDEYRFLSNFFYCSFYWHGFNWSSSEAAYQASKSLDYNDWVYISKLSPAQSKKYGQQIKLREDWETIKYEIMYQIVYSKFSQNELLKFRLESTENAILEEGNTWGDKIWGICPPKSGIGQNALGNILMLVRKELE